jgi:restriction system protein
MHFGVDFQRLMGARVEMTERDGTRLSTAGGAPEACDSVSALVASAHARLVQDLIGCVHAQSPEFFERLIIDVLLAMGYGGNRDNMARSLGRTGDGGVDGVIVLDELGFDSIYIQAKRLKPGSAVPVSDLRDFAGSLEARHASKGVLVTTAHFSGAATSFCSLISRRIVLIDGVRLAELMIRYNIGVEVRHCFLLKGLDDDYFKLGSERRQEQGVVGWGKHP